MRKPVELKFSNGFGLYDMHGSLLEWTGDWYGCSYPQSTTDPRCGTGSNRVYRGGDWTNSALIMRASTRINRSPSVRYSSLGFLTLNPVDGTDRICTIAERAAQEDTVAKLKRHYELSQDD